MRKMIKNLPKNRITMFKDGKYMRNPDGTFIIEKRLTTPMGAKRLMKTDDEIDTSIKTQQNRIGDIH